ncbi:phage virion morphogenesis protein [Acinetobacter baumannii]|uniref:phage virion morphogenesis protein n=1 Tax=Acinetobacter baumannii TaxID=470 RepID=UPI0007077F80|nr:phage virion morphogenesis protein [Acinetobacter baumannii]KQK67650.1 virion morphogenesis protein [Acinetobacter baumannii]
MSFIQLKDDALIDRMAQAADRMVDTTPLSAAIANTFATITDDNFDAGGRPKWAGLSPDRSEPSNLYKSGNLRRSITTQHTRDQAIIGTIVPYAGILHFGGKTKPHVIRPRNKQALSFNGMVFKQVNHPGSKFPARPFLPMDEHGFLQREAEDAVFDDVDFYWHKSFA